MLNLLELEQLAAFAAEGTLSKAAEKLHISQPTITRTMQHLEEDFGVSLFRRTKNHIALNETGWKAVEYAERILKSTEEEPAYHYRQLLRPCASVGTAPCSYTNLSGYDHFLIDQGERRCPERPAVRFGCSWSAASGYGAPGILQHSSVKRRPLCVPACHPCTCRI